MRIYQFGPIGFVDVKGRSFSTRTQKLKLTKGALVEYEKNATSSAAAATKMASEQSTSIFNAYKEYVTAETTKATAARNEEKAAVLAEITRQRDIRTKEIDLAAIERKLQANQVKYEAATTDAERETARTERDALLKQQAAAEADLAALRKGVTLPAGSSG